MSMGVFMPMPAPLLGGGDGGGLEGEITVGENSDFGFTFYGWSDGSLLPVVVGSLSGVASTYFQFVFFWRYDALFGTAILSPSVTDAVLHFQGETYSSEYDSDNGAWVFMFGPEVSTWPTSGTHPFTLILP